MRCDGVVMAEPPLPVTGLVGTAEHYAELLKLFGRRVEELNLTYESVDFLAGFPARYTATLLSGSGGKAMSIFSFFTMVRVLALLPTFAHDETQLANLRARPDWIGWKRPGRRWRPRKPKPRKRASGHARHVEFTLWPDLLRKSAQQGGYARAAKMTPEERTASARRAALARWHKNGATPVV
jgi:hypothetical protein